MDRAQILALDFLCGDEVRKSLHRNKYEIEIKKSVEEERIVYGIVLRPNRPDAHQDVMKPEEVRKAAHHWMAIRGDIFQQHQNKALAVPLESYVAPSDMTLENGSIVKKGDWVMCVKVLSDDLWKQIKNGEVTSFSPGGYGVFTLLEDGQV